MGEAPSLKSKDLFPSIFSRYAAAYQQRMDEIMARGEARGRQRAIDLLELGPGMQVLDLACGPGTLTRPIAERVAPGGVVTGIDLAEGMIELARAAGVPHARFDVMDMENLEFPDSSFDAAACGHGLQFAPDLPRALAEARRVLRLEARFAASIPAHGPEQGAWSVIDEVVDRWLPPAPKAADQGATRRTVNDPKALRAAVLAAGFARAGVEVIDEKVRWDSAEQIVSRCMSWWDLAARLEGVSAGNREAFRDDAIATLRRKHPGVIETTGRTHVLWAAA